MIAIIGEGSKQAVEPLGQRRTRGLGVNPRNPNRFVKLAKVID